MGKTPHGGCNRSLLASAHESLSIEEYIDDWHVHRGFMRQADQGIDCNEQSQTGVGQMILGTIVFIWMALTALLILALCRAAKRPVPKPPFSDGSKSSNYFPRHIR